MARKPHPYIPNSVPEVKAEMLGVVGAASAEELYAEMIPRRLLMKGRMDLPEPLPAEHDLKKHVAEILMKNRTCGDALSFLGGGCWNHFVPQVCDEIARRSEFLTAYAGGYYSDLGRFQANWEFQSLICELVGMEVSGIPTYDWGGAAGNAVRMASRLTGRREVLVPASMSPARLSVVANFCNPTEMPGAIKIRKIAFNKESGILDLKDLRKKINGRSACVYFENPGYLGAIEDQGEEIADIAHKAGAEVVVGVDPISLGVLAPPSDYGADIVCGEVQPLGVHMAAGGGLAGFIASRDEERYVAEYPLRLISVTNTVREGEYAFGQAKYERTSYMAREKAKDWVGTTTALHGIIAAVYMSLLGPEGMKEVGEAILQKSHYAAGRLGEIKGVEARFPGFFKEFPLNIDATGKKVGQVNKALLKRGIFGGKDISREFPELGQSALTCVTEVHSKADIDRFAEELEAILG
ncbi:MAG: aminomethyl-transferring glycine dehydrogenase subunit GcvPA [Candidatus Bathyarchaeota archaeon]|nr:aminomethyl-transferring glycine dehydrogenase subunit GcvPA [Candidatus Bathyarchaeota archaeon]